MASPSSLAAWAAGKRAGLLARQSDRTHVFAYNPDVEPDVQVSLTMPLRLAGWLSPELHPIFQMNLPEGALLETIRRAIAKLIGDDDLALLMVTGGNQVGRNRFSLPDADFPCFDEAPESLEELLAYPDTEELFHELVNRYALRSGISGVQPKVMVEASERNILSSRGYIIKSWGSDYPFLAANEYFCITAAGRAGLPVPECYLSDNGGLFVMRRFDLGNDGEHRGFEDMCSLQAKGTTRKYSGSYERIARSISDFVSGHRLMAARKQFFATLILSAMVRNGDGHLKNFGVCYDAPGSTVELAPVYDVVTTTAYIRNDVPALTLEGTKKWWLRKTLERFAAVHLSLPPSIIAETFSRTAEAVTDVAAMIPAYISDHPEFAEVGGRMLAAWNEGVSGLMR